MHEQDGHVGVVAERRQEDRAVHVLVPARLEHQRAADLVRVVLDPLAALENGQHGHIGEPTANQTQRLAGGVHVHDLDRQSHRALRCRCLGGGLLSLFLERWFSVGRDVRLGSNSDVGFGLRGWLGRGVIGWLCERPRSLLVLSDERLTGDRFGAFIGLGLRRYELEHVRRRLVQLWRRRVALNRRLGLVTPGCVEHRRRVSDRRRVFVRIGCRLGRCEFVFSRVRSPRRAVELVSRIRLRLDLNLRCNARRRDRRRLKSLLVRIARLDVGNWNDALHRRV